MDALPVVAGRTGRVGHRFGDQANFPSGQRRFAVGLVSADQRVAYVEVAQTPEIEVFVDLSADAVKGRIWNALICMLLVC